MTTSGQIPQSPWPKPVEESVLFLLDAGNRVERGLLARWLASTRHSSGADDTTSDQLVLPILHAREGQTDTAPLEEKLEAAGHSHVVPLRVVWLPAKSARQTAPRVRDLFLGNPRHPGSLAAQMILRRNPDRVRCMAGASATIEELRKDFSKLKSGDDGEAAEDFAAFVVRRAGLALDVAERRFQGNRYKVPRFVAQGLRASHRYNSAMDKLAREQGRPVKELHAEARTYMKEMVAEPNTYFIDWMGKFARFAASLAYGKEIVCSPECVERTQQILREYPSALLWTHKSYIDGMAVISVLYDNDLPAPHSLGGINMAFAGLGFLGRKSGIIYIRRSFQDNPVYKLVFRHYLGYLMEKRFPFSWAFEGTRSRVGKLMPPRYGLLKYVIEAAHATNASDLHFIPVSISYDLIGDVADYAMEQSGQQKRPESLRWFVGYLRKLRAPMGRMYLDFGEPVVVPGVTPAPDDVDLSKIAFEVAVRVNKLTPVTLPSLICLVLLGAAPRALTFAEVAVQLDVLIAWLRQRNIRMAGCFDKGNARQLRDLAQIVIDRGLVTLYDEGPEPVYGIADDQYPVAGYYRNTVVHYFVSKAIMELALVKASAHEPSERLDIFWYETDHLRDLFKFEFFYTPKEEFRDELEQELSAYEKDWQEILKGDSQNVLAMLAGMRPLIAHATLLPYIEAYGVVAGVLERLEPDAGLDEIECVALSLKYGHQRLLQRRVSSKASIAKLLFQNGHKLFTNLSLTEGGDPALASRREAASKEFADLSDRLSRISALAQAEQSGAYAPAAVPRTRQAAGAS